MVQTNCAIMKGLTVIWQREYSYLHQLVPKPYMFELNLGIGNWTQTTNNLESKSNDPLRPSKENQYVYFSALFEYSLIFFEASGVLHKQV